MHESLLNSVNRPSLINTERNYQCFITQRQKALCGTRHDSKKWLGVNSLILIIKQKNKGLPRIDASRRFLPSVYVSIGVKYKWKGPYGNLQVLGIDFLLYGGCHIILCFRMDDLRHPKKQGKEE